VIVFSGCPYSSVGRATDL